MKGISCRKFDVDSETFLVIYDTLTRNPEIAFLKNYKQYTIVLKIGKN